MDKRVIARLKDVRVVLVSAILLGLFSTLLLLVQAQMMAGIVSGSFIGHESIHTLEPLMWVLLGTLLLRGTISFSSRIVVGHLSHRLKTSLRGQLLGHLVALGPMYFKKEQSGEVVQTAFDGIEQLDTYVSDYVPQLALAVITPLAIFAFIVSKDLITAVILCVSTPLVPIFMILIGKSAQSLTDRQWRLMGVLSGHFVDLLKGLPTLRVFQRTKAQVDIIRRMTDEYRRATMKPLRVAFLSAFVLELLTTLSTAMVAVGLGLRLLSGRMSFVDAFVVLLLVPDFFLPIRALGTKYHASMNGISAAHRIFDILDEPILALPLPGRTGEKTGLHEIEFRDVSFTYPGAEQPVLQSISFKIKPSDVVAIVGLSGAGKSTLLDLLLGFLTPTDGHILVDGVNLTDLSGSWWRQEIGYVSQSPYLFSDTVAANISLHRPSADENCVRSAAKRALADDFILDLPQGYDTVIGEGGQSLSGGQAQRIAIARALYKKAQILTLDEPTAHLDVESESALSALFASVDSAQTMIYIAHRLSTARIARRIIVLHEGKIVEEGSHDELMQKDGLYRRMYGAYSGEGLVRSCELHAL